MTHHNLYFLGTYQNQEHIFSALKSFLFHYADYV